MKSICSGQCNGGSHFWQCHLSPLSLLEWTRWGQGFCFFSSAYKQLLRKMPGTWVVNQRGSASICIQVVNCSTRSWPRGFGGWHKLGKEPGLQERRPADCQQEGGRRADERRWVRERSEAEVKVKAAFRLSTFKTQDPKHQRVLPKEFLERTGIWKVYLEAKIFSNPCSIVMHIFHEIFEESLPYTDFKTFLHWNLFSFYTIFHKVFWSALLCKLFSVLISFLSLALAHAELIACMGSAVNPHLLVNIALNIWSLLKICW